ncbi:hypothetical protein HN873_064955, partial [Arachis hypogaea]
MGSGNSPCASCKLLRRRCAKDCIFAPYFPSDDPQKFAIVHKVFGASNVSKMLQEFLCCGRFIFGPDIKSIFLTIFLIVAPVAVFSFCAFVARKLLDDFSHHSGYSIMIIEGILALCLEVFVLQSQIAGFNIVGFGWITSPAATELETIVLNLLAKALKLPHDFHSTASEAVLVVLLAARDKILRTVGKDALPKLVTYASDQTHSSLLKACQVTKSDASTNYVLSPEVFFEAVSRDIASGLIPFFLCATVGTTSSTAIDPLPELGKIANNVANTTPLVDMLQEKNESILDKAALKNAKDSKDGIGKEITSLQAAVEAAVG